MAEILRLPVAAREAWSADHLLYTLIGKELKSLTIVGETSDGQSVLQSTHTNLRDMLWDLARAQRWVLDGDIDDDENG